MSGSGVAGLIVGEEGCTVICALSTTVLSLTQGDMFHPLSSSCTKSREGF